MAAEDPYVQLIGRHRMIYALNVPHYYIELPELLMYRTEQTIHSITATPGARFLVRSERRNINDHGPFDVHFMMTRQRTGWTRETVVFRSGEPSPYPVEERTVLPEEPTPLLDNDDDLIRRIVIRPADPSKEKKKLWADQIEDDPCFRRIRTNFAEPRSYWDEIEDSAEDLDAEDLDAEDLDAEDLDAEDLDAEEMDRIDHMFDDDEETATELDCSVWQ
jgi:hypothetical protein